MLLATGSGAKRERRLDAASQSFSHFYARGEPLTKREITYSSLNIVRSAKPDLETV